MNALKIFELLSSWQRAKKVRIEYRTFGRLWSNWINCNNIGAFIQLRPIETNYWTSRIRQSHELPFLLNITFKNETWFCLYITTLTKLSKNPVDVTKCTLSPSTFKFRSFEWPLAGNEGTIFWVTSGFLSASKLEIFYERPDCKF